MKRAIFLLALFLAVCNAQNLNWEQIQDDGLPEGVTFFKGRSESPQLNAWYFKVDLSNPDLALKAYLSGQSKLVTDFTKDVGAYAAINGGYFSGNTALSAVIEPDQVLARNVTALNRNSKSYPVIRSLFSLDTLKNPGVDYVYQFDLTMNGIYTYDNPLPYVYNDPNPMPVPSKNDGTLFDDILMGIGGAPVLIRDSVINITYNEEIMWGAGAGELNDLNPRTAVGYTSDNQVIMLVVDGRSTESVGVSFPELARIMLNLGCVEAMNLDGGGSTQMAIGNQYVNNPSEFRSVPAILAIVHIDSLITPVVVDSNIIDTADERCSVTGNWFETANSGFYLTPSLLNQIGKGDDFVEFRPMLKQKGTYDLYAWWVAAFNRSEDTPFIIDHVNGTTEIRADQTINGSDWIKLGRFYFAGDSTDKVVISDNAQTGTYVVADAIRFALVDTSDVTSIEVRSRAVSSFDLLGNYPNPFNPETIIHYQLSEKTDVELAVFDVRGRKVATLVKGIQNAGNHQVLYSPNNVSSGIYFYSLFVGNKVQHKKMILIK